MTDCGISCGACPLAGLCGDPLPEPAPVACQYNAAPHALNAECVNVTPVCVQTSRSVVACGSTTVRTAPETVDPEWDSLADALRDAGLDPDAPDVDPAEPKPEGAGCCGGACARC